MDNDLDNMDHDSLVPEGEVADAPRVGKKEQGS